ncbi:hypothetical protein Tco_1341771 [Tanacetum coccineum]
MAQNLVLFQKLVDAAGSTNLRDQMLPKEEDCRRELLRQLCEVIEQLNQREAYIAEIKVLGPRVKPLSFMIEIHTEETDKHNLLREMLAESEVLLRRKWWYCSKVLTIGL